MFWGCSKEKRILTKADFDELFTDSKTTSREQIKVTYDSKPKFARTKKRKKKKKYIIEMVPL